MRASARLGKRPDGERHDLEPVDVDEAAVGELERRDHGEREERERQERRRADPAELLRRVVAPAALRDDDVERLEDLQDILRDQGIMRSVGQARRPS